MNKKLRKERDSNPRYPCEYTCFPGKPVQPLLHLSENEVPNIRRLGLRIHKKSKKIMRKERDSPEGMPMAEPSGN